MANEQEGVVTDLKTWLQQFQLESILKGLVDLGFEFPSDFTNCREDDIRQIAEGLKLLVGVKMRFVRAVRELPNSTIGKAEESKSPNNSSAGPTTTPVILINEEERTALNNLKTRKEETLNGIQNVDQTMTDIEKSCKVALEKISKQQEAITLALEERVRALREDVTTLRTKKLGILKTQKQQMREMHKITEQAQKQCYQTLQKQFEVAGTRDDLVACSRNAIAKTKPPEEFEEIQQVEFFCRHGILLRLPNFGIVDNARKINIENLPKLEKVPGEEKESSYVGNILDELFQQDEDLFKQEEDLQQKINELEKEKYEFLGKKLDVEDYDKVREKIVQIDDIKAQIDDIKAQIEELQPKIKELSQIEEAHLMSFDVIERMTFNIGALEVNYDVRIVSKSNIPKFNNIASKDTLLSMLACPSIMEDYLTLHEVKCQNLNLNVIQGSNPPAKGMLWQLAMSSKYGSIPSTYEALTNGSTKMNDGAMTLSTPSNPFIAAVFPETYTVSAVTLGGQMLSSTNYTNGCALQYLSIDDFQWTDLVAVVGGVPKGEKKFAFAAVVTPAIRLMKKSGNVATNLLVIE